MKIGSHRVDWRSLARKSDFQLVYERGAKRVGRLVVVYLLVPGQDQIEAGNHSRPDLARAVVASKKVGNAVARNRAKRLLREAHRLSVLGNLGHSAGAEQAEQDLGWLLRGPGSHQSPGAELAGAPSAENAAQAEQLNKSAGLWVVLVARQRILSATSREAREELDKLLKAEPQLQ